VQNCTQCIAANLPPNPVGFPITQTAGMLYTVNSSLYGYCAIDPVARNISNAYLLQLGNIATAAFESPIELFNMTLIDHPIPYPYNPSGCSLLPSTTASTLTSTSTSTSTHVSSSTHSSTSTSSPTPSPTPWSTLPANAAMQACESK
jgi:ABC-type uncharacterized transport system involved in gliding motility auxiliary subunit